MWDLLVSFFCPPEVAGLLSQVLLLCCLMELRLLSLLSVGLPQVSSLCFLLIKVLLSSLLTCLCVVLDCLVSALMHDVHVQLVNSVWCMDSKLET